MVIGGFETIFDEFRENHGYRSQNIPTSTYFASRKNPPILSAHPRTSYMESTPTPSWGPDSFWNSKSMCEMEGFHTNSDEKVHQ